MSEVRLKEQFDLSRFLDNPSFVHTVNLILENGEGGEKKGVVVSGMVLAQFSEYFEELLSKGESEFVVSSDPLLFDKDVQLKEFLCLLSGGTVEINNQNVAFFVKLALSYGIKQILLLCYKWLKHHVDTANALLLVELSLMSASINHLRDQPALARFYAHSVLSSDFEIVLDILNRLKLDPLLVLKSEVREMSCVRTLLSDNNVRLLTAVTTAAPLSNETMEHITLRFSYNLRNAGTETNVETLKVIVKDQHEILLHVLLTNDLEDKENTAKEATNISSDEEVDDDVLEEVDDHSSQDSTKQSPVFQATKKRTTTHSSDSSSNKVRKCDRSDLVSTRRVASNVSLFTKAEKVAQKQTKRMRFLVEMMYRRPFLEPLRDKLDPALLKQIQFEEFSNLIIEAEFSDTGRICFTEKLLKYVELSSEATVQHFIIENYISNARFKEMFQIKQKFLVFLMRLAEKVESIKYLQMLVNPQNDIFLEIIKEQRNQQIVQPYVIRRAKPRTSLNISNCNLSQFEILPVIPGNEAETIAKIRWHPIVQLSYDALLELRDNRKMNEYKYIETCLFWIFHHTHPNQHYINNNGKAYVDLSVEDKKVYILIDSFNLFKVNFDFLSMIWKVYDIHKRFPECDFPEKDKWPVQLQSVTEVKNVCPKAPLHSYSWAKSQSKRYYFISEVTDADRTMSVLLNSSSTLVEYPCGENCLYCQHSHKHSAHFN